MDENNIKISACILSRNDSQFIKECIDSIYPYIDEIIILDASDDDSTYNIIKDIKNSLSYSSKSIIYERTYVSQNVSTDRNKMQQMASGDYVLHIDCDERFDIDFLSLMKPIISIYLYSKILPILFRFPRLNRPDNINYPDYQIRLLNRNYTKWIGDVHETPEIIPIDKKQIGMKIHNMITFDYPMVHLYKDKTQLQVRWKNMLNKDVHIRRKKLLFLSMFKNSNPWIEDILSCINNFYRFNYYVDHQKKLKLNFSFVDGRSNDGTFGTLERYCKEECILNVQLRKFESDIGPRFKRLADVRNYTIEQSVRQFPLEDDDYILFADSDIKFTGDVIHELIKDMENCAADIIAPMIFIDNFRGHDNSYFYDVLAFKSLDGTPFKHDTPYFSSRDINRPNEIGSVGSFYVMKYKVMRKIKFTGESDSEQVEFCNNARSAGFKIFVSPRLSVQHINFDEYNMPWH